MLVELSGCSDEIDMFHRNIVLKFKRNHDNQTISFHTIKSTYQSFKDYKYFIAFKTFIPKIFQSTFEETSSL